MLATLGAIVVGLILLVWSADRFVEGACAIAQHLGVSSLIVGIIIVGFGTSAPEILISIIAVLEGTPNIAIGNALGSNIANIGLILGATALLAPLPIKNIVLKREFPLLLLATAVMAYCLYDSSLDLFDGVILVIILIVMLWYLIGAHRRDDKYATMQQGDISEPSESGQLNAWGWTLLGLILLVGSSKLLVWGASEMAHAFGISELIIGLTIVALGTSLPELAAAFASVKKGVPDLAIGNVVGSNLFNSLAVVGVPAIITNFDIGRLAVTRDLPVVIALTLLFYCLARFPMAPKQFLSRLKGFWLLAAFVIYQTYLYYSVLA